MELCEDGDLQAIVDQKKAQYDEDRDGVVPKGIHNKALLKHLFSQICDSVDSVHTELNMGHFDIKLQNFLINKKDAQVKLIDFGVAKNLDHSVEDLSRCRTAMYTAPEILAGKAPAAIDRRKCDIFSLGVMLYTMYFGIHPWHKSATPDDMHFKAFSMKVRNFFKYHKATRDLVSEKKLDA